MNKFYVDPAERGVDAAEALAKAGQAVFPGVRFAIGPFHLNNPDDNLGSTTFIRIVYWLEHGKLPDWLEDAELPTVTTGEPAGPGERVPLTEAAAEEQAARPPRSPIRFPVHMLAPAEPPAVLVRGDDGGYEVVPDRPLTEAFPELAAVTKALDAGEAGGAGEGGDE